MQTREQPTNRRSRKAAKRRRRIIIRVSILLLLLIALGFGVYKGLGALVPALSDAIFSDKPKQEEPAPPQEAVLSSSFSPDQLSSPYMCLVDLYDHRILAEHNSQMRVSPASLTKIMTALVAIEHLEDLQKPLTVPQSIFSYLYDSHASVAGFSPNEQLPAIDVLYGCALPSGADASLTLAVSIAGSEAGYVELMNQKAQELGLSDTHFQNVSGLYAPDHYSTARDMALLFETALENETFREIFSAASYTTTPTSFHPEGLTFRSTMFGRMSSPYFKDGQILGGKTGYISDAGMCLASYAIRKERPFLLITMGADGDPYGDPLHLWDAFTVYDSLIDAPKQEGSDKENAS